MVLPDSGAVVGWTFVAVPCVHTVIAAGAVEAIDVIGTNALNTNSNRAVVTRLIIVCVPCPTRRFDAGDSFGYSTIFSVTRS